MVIDQIDASADKVMVDLVKLQYDGSWHVMINGWKARWLGKATGGGSDTFRLITFSHPVVVTGFLIEAIPVIGNCPSAYHLEASADGTIWTATGLTGDAAACKGNALTTTERGNLHISSDKQD